MSSRSALKLCAAVVGVVIAASACSTLDPYTREEKTSHAQRQAVIGSAAGAAVGLITGDSVTRSGDHITLNMPRNITFATDSADLNAGFFDVLNSVGKVVNEFSQPVIEVAGHTDSTGSDQYNQQLSEKRANAVAAYLKTRDVRSDRIITVGAGEAHPVASNDTPDGRQRNRRVERRLVVGEPAAREDIAAAGV